MTLVLDASAVIDLLLRSDPGERVRVFLRSQPNISLVTVSHLDAEVFSGLARLERAGDLTADEVTILLDRLSELTMTRVPITRDLLQMAWNLRDNVSARDALYVAAAMALDVALVTTDQRLARSVPDHVAELDNPNP